MGQGHHLVVRVEAQEMDWMIGSQIIIQPTAELPSIFQFVSDFWNYEVSELHVDLGLVLDLQYRLEDRFSIRDSDVFSHKIRFSVTLEVDRNTIQKIIHHSDRVGSIVAVRDEDVDQSVPPRLNANIVRELHEYRRLIVRVGKTLTTVANSQCRNLRGHHIRPLHFPPLTDVKVLAVRAEPVTSRSCYGENLRAGHVMCDWLLLNRINVSSYHFAVDQ